MVKPITFLAFIQLALLVQPSVSLPIGWASSLFPEWKPRRLFAVVWARDRRDRWDLRSARIYTQTDLTVRSELCKRLDSTALTVALLATVPVWGYCCVRACGLCVKPRTKEECDVEAGNQPNEHEAHNHPQPGTHPQSEGSETDSSDRYYAMFFWRIQTNIAWKIYGKRSQSSPVRWSITQPIMRLKLISFWKTSCEIAAQQKSKVCYNFTKYVHTNIPWKTYCQ
jgi:hypothetical protein